MYRIVLVFLLLGGCSLYPPMEGVNHSGGRGIDEIVTRYGLQPLDPGSDIPLTKQALEELEKTDPLRLYRGTTYRLTDGNRLSPEWIIQTPDEWGFTAESLRYFPLDCSGCDADFRLPACRRPPDCHGAACAPLAASVARPGARPRRFCLGHSDALVDVIYKLVISATVSVDIVELAPPADGRFLAALRNALTWLAHSGRPVTVRVIVGDYPPNESVDIKKLAHQLLRDASKVPMSRLRIYVGATRSCDANSACPGLSWNHAKVVAVDGRKAIVGGHNLWSPDYLVNDPVHDLSMEVDGPAAHDAERFADELWRSVCSQSLNDGVNDHAAFFGARARDRDDTCVKKIDLPNDQENAGGVPILSVGRLAAGIAPVFADQSLIARDLMLGAARRSIRMVQQDIAFALLGTFDRSWPNSVLDTIADLMTKWDGNVYLILSNPGAAGPIGTYSNGVSLESVAQKVKDVVAQRSGLTDPALSVLLCDRFHLAPLRFGPDATWPDGKPIGTHAKFWMIDDRAFYVGSENIYPTDLQEFGFIVEDAAAAATLRAAYWDLAWKWSQLAAISGSDAPKCIFTASADAKPPEPRVANLP
jgi:phosphatidylserine/phosphatidylglycerophosphate/cardiolipin synthase-like enzyme